MKKAIGNILRLSLSLIVCFTFSILMYNPSSTAQSLLTKHPALFKQEIDIAVKKIDKVLSSPIAVPIPKDMAGGYTHEQHKRNYRDLQTAGQLYILKKEKKYAEYIKNVFFEYAKIFKSLPIHPTDRSYATGKIFWQCLNDANWMVYGSQAYSAIYDYLSKEDREYIENEFLRPYADFISIENPKFFNRVHNHSTWGNAAVGMVGIAIKDKSLIDRALYGLQLDDVDHLAKDNDGGFIYEKGKVKAGFFAQIDFSFSPDGYYGEGPYYQRYAMLPFMIFAQALDESMPEVKIFAYRDSILIKAVEALLYQTNQSDEFFPINDAQKGMSIHPNSVVTAVDIAYANSKMPIFLEAARKQQTVLLTTQGLLVASDLEKRNKTTFTKKSINFRDGFKGDEGGLAVLRAGAANKQTTVVFKYTAQGLGHGHYDKLTYLLYDGDTEVMQDYGAARWVNIDQKAGGRYLKENKSWSKQTIAHNTLVVDRTSHFGGKYDVANEHHSDLLFFNTNNPKLQTVGGIEKNAYPGTEMQRILLLWEDIYFENPVFIDLFNVISTEEHEYEMPYQYAGQIMSQNFEYTINSPSIIMGEKHGYQHLYNEASGNLTNEGLQMNWFKDRKFYTLTASSDDGDKCILARIGANDPSFNLRRDAILIHNKPSAKNTTFASVIENHGTYSPVTEVPINPYSKIAKVQIDNQNKQEIMFSIIAKDSSKWSFVINKLTGEASVKKIQ